MSKNQEKVSNKKMVWHVTWPKNMWHDSIICDMTHAFPIVWRSWKGLRQNTWWNTWHDSFICDMTHPYVTWLIHSPTRKKQKQRLSQKRCCYMWHDSFFCDMTHSFVTWLIHLWHDSFTCNTTHPYMTWLIHLQPIAEGWQSEIISKNYRLVPCVPGFSWDSSFITWY